MSFIRTVAASALLLIVSCRTSHAPLRIAAAADLRFALPDIVDAFRQSHSGIAVEPAYGSSGMFYAQLVNRAPFDIFLSADVQYPRKLSDQGLILPGSMFHYASGRIVLWTANTTNIDVERLGVGALSLPAVRHIAIANPQHAPYGRAAEAALHSLGVYDAVQPRLVMGENIAQTFQMAQSGAAEIGIVALSLAMAPGASGQGHYWEVPQTAYPPIEQGGAILKWTKDADAAQDFRALLQSDRGRAILKRYGFSVE